VSGAEIRNDGEDWDVLALMLGDADGLLEGCEVHRWMNGDDDVRLERLERLDRLEAASDSASAHFLRVACDPVLVGWMDG